MRYVRSKYMRKGRSKLESYFWSTSLGAKERRIAKAITKKDNRKEQKSIRVFLL